MTDRPILFSGPMVSALLAGTKTQTRRVLKPQPDAPQGIYSNIKHARRALRIMEGDRLWVRETWKPHSIYAGMRPRDIPQTNIFYRADGRYAPSNTPWKPGIHMTRWASRLTLRVIGVKIERLQDISPDDAEAEGIRIAGADVAVYRDKAATHPEAARRWNAYRIRQYRDVWNMINGSAAWDANPWVVAYTFSVEQRNIDHAPMGEAV